MDEKRPHSKLAVASAIIPVAVWIYVPAAIRLLMFSKDFHRFLNLFLDGSLGAAGVTLILLAIVLIGIPAAAHLTGIIFGLIGFFDKKKRGIYAVPGLIFNIMPFVAIIGLVIYGLIYLKSGQKIAN